LAFMNGCHLTESNVAGYLQSLRMMERTGATIQKYVHGVRSFMEWLDVRPVTKELTAQWKHGLMEEGLSPSTINGRIAAVNGLFHFLGWTEYQVRALKIQRQAFRDGGGIFPSGADGAVTEPGTSGTGDVNHLLDRYPCFGGAVYYRRSSAAGACDRLPERENPNDSAAGQAVRQAAAICREAGDYFRGNFSDRRRQKPFPI